MSALFRTWPECALAALDIGLLPIRDRACLRVLDRYESATAEHSPSSSIRGCEPRSEACVGFGVWACSSGSALMPEQWTRVSPRLRDRPRRAAPGAPARSVIVPLAVASLLTGLVVSLGTKWGPLRHWWVLVSLTLTVFATVVVVVETGTIAAYAAVAADPGATEGELAGWVARWCTRSAARWCCWSCWSSTCTSRRV